NFKKEQAIDFNHNFRLLINPVDSEERKRPESHRESLIKRSNSFRIATRHQTPPFCLGTMRALP
ncbi:MULTISPECIES: hypothetical protein, partial [unclassified Ensifer]|uniref:hypothetical protein n=1 Tax=unclassified Ensifer TaxID=2633371 RepID=UPI00300FC7A3